MENINGGIGYLFGMNLISFVLCGVDKWKAKMHKRRISENSLLLSCILGGSVGFIVGMKIFSHKTKHLKFTVGVPLVLSIQVIIGYFVYMKRFA